MYRVSQKQCSVEGCGKSAKAHSFCNTHYERWRRSDRTTTEKIGLRTEKECKRCGEKFKLVSGIQKYCANCTTFTYRNCGKEYRFAGTKTSKFCSKKCFDDFRRGKKFMGRKTPLSAEARARIGAATRKRFEGVNREEYIAKISSATKLAMQRVEVQKKIRAPRGALTLEQRMVLSNKLAGRMPANLGYASPGKYPNVKRGYYDINGTTMYFRSKWEANYALYLDFLIDHRQIKKWEFEPDTFMFEQIKLGTRSYTPDFKVFNNDGSHEYHEVKGYMDSKSKTKLRRFAKYYALEKLVLIDSSMYALLKKQVGKICKFYE